MRGEKCAHLGRAVVAVLGGRRPPVAGAGVGAGGVGLGSGSGSGLVVLGHAGGRRVDSGRCCGSAAAVPFGLGLVGFVEAVSGLFFGRLDAAACVYSGPVVVLTRVRVRSVGWFARRLFESKPSPSPQ